MLGIDCLTSFYNWRKASRHNSINDDMLIIGMSANALGDAQDEAFKVGMHFFVSKPVEVDLLQLVLDASKSHSSLEARVNDIAFALELTRANGDNFSGLIRAPPKGNRGADGGLVLTTQSTYERHPEVVSGRGRCGWFC